MTETIQRRYSCRSYARQPIDPELRAQLEEAIASPQVGPFGTSVRFALLATTEQDRSAIQGLTTYGMIKNAPAFLCAAMPHSDRNLEDLGFLMEQFILSATEIGLGTCWLGGTFNRSVFAERIALSSGETLPAVIAVGHIARRARAIDGMIRLGIRADKRLPWDRLFYDGSFDTPLGPERAGDHAIPLEMVRLGPSASNRQPWRIVRGENAWHLYLARTPGYRRISDGSLAADMQRIDMGIAMCHWQLAATAEGLSGTWQVEDPGIALPNELTEYVVSWDSARAL
jgi:nitroreductase